MNNIIEQMLSKYEIKNLNDEINALKEIIQEIVLAGLSRGGFFNDTATTEIYTLSLHDALPILMI